MASPNKPKWQRKVQLDFKAAPFSKSSDEPAPLYNKYRRWLEQATGVCLGRCNWTGTLRVICTEAQYGRLALLALQDEGLKRLLDNTLTAYIEEHPGVTTFYGKGLNDEELGHG